MHWKSLFHRKQRKAESDVEVDPGTPGPTPGGEFVGRVGGSDPGHSDETGAERRADAGDEER